MPDVHTSSSPALQSLPPKKSIFARLSSPFASASRTVAEFTVQADDPHRRYCPADLVRGSVILKLIKATRITHITVCLHGFVQVYKTPGQPPADGFRAHNNIIGKGKGNKQGAYFGNGFATLFEEELVLCGDGKLDEGNYKFEYQLKFPDQTLPSSIDFERGTVSYMVTATLTRPHSISPILFDDQKIFFNERIDIAQLLPPKPRTISLEPLLKRTQTKSSSKRRATQADSVRHEDGTSTPTQGTPRSLARLASDFPPRSPSPSLRSLGSRRSSGPCPSEPGSYARSSHASENLSAVNLNSTSGASARRITVTVESLKGGTLRGDTIPLHLVVHHTKHIKSVRGVIITLFRQARVDTHPALPLGPTTDGEKRRFEDYYPKSLTGLGGLSLSSAGSSHLFRKDLSQVVAPLIVDPTTLVAELHPKVRVPDDSFPTIACVPGAMISFKYYMEVVIDIQGKLSGSDKYLSQPNPNSFAEYSMNNTADANSGRSERYLPNSYLTPMIDTTGIRREKSVVTCVLEVVVGTEDSERRKGKLRANLSPEAQQISDFSYEAHQTAENTGEFVDVYGGNPPGAQYRGPYATQYFGAEQWEGDYEDPPEFYPPDSLPETGQSEKERMRRAELALLPSQPPEEEIYEDTYLDSRNVPIFNPGDTGFVGFQYASQSPQHGVVAIDHPSASTGTPRYSQIDQRPGACAGAIDHKEDEARRSQLEQQASAPPSGTSTTEDHIYGPMVPHDYDIDDLEHGLSADTSGYVTNAVDHLPRYER